MKRTIIVMLLCVGIVGAQQAGSLVWNPAGSSITVSGPATPATLSFTLPSKNGTFALTSDIVPTTPTVTITNGSITLVNGTGTATIPSTIQRCIVSDASGNSVKYSKGSSSLTVQGVGPVVDFACF